MGWEFGEAEAVNQMVLPVCPAFHKQTAVPAPAWEGGWTGRDS